MITPSAFPPQALKHTGKFQPHLAEEQKSGIHEKTASQAVTVVAWLANCLLESISICKAVKC